MHKIWVSLTAFALASAFLLPVALAQDRPAAAAGVPVITPEDHVLGKPDAPVTIIEYGSLTCPHCAEFQRTTLPKLKAAWIDTGKAKLVFRDFPLDNLALRAAMLAQCAPADKYYSYVDTLFLDQATWERARDPKAALGKIAKLGGMTDAQFDACMADEGLMKRIVAGETQAQKEYGVDSTPTFFVNGAKMNPNGAQPFEVFDKVLTEAMAKS